MEIKVFSLEINHVTVAHLTIEPSSWGKRLREMVEVVLPTFKNQNDTTHAKERGKSVERSLYSE